MGAGTGMAATGLEPGLVDVLAVFIIAGTVGLFVASLAGFETGIQLTHDVIIFVLLPPLLFGGPRRPTSRRSGATSRSSGSPSP